MTVLNRAERTTQYISWIIDELTASADRELAKIRPKEQTDYFANEENRRNYDRARAEGGV